MSERLVIGGKFTDLSGKDPEQLGRLNNLLEQMLAVTNSFDQNSFALAWIEGSAAGQVIASTGVGNAPVWDSTPILTGLTLNGLTASKMVVTTAGKALASQDIPSGTTPASSVVAETSFGQSSAVGTGTNYARNDHTHGTPTDPVTAHVAAGDPHTQYQKESEKDAANGYAGLNASSRTTKGVDTTDDLIVDLATKGLVLKDTQGTPHFWRISVSTLGVLTTADLGTSKP